MTVLGVCNLLKIKEYEVKTKKPPEFRWFLVKAFWLYVESKIIDQI